MKNKQRDLQNQDYINEFQNWQDNQYNPGYYTGGKIPPYLKSPGNRKYLAISLLIIGIMSSAVVIELATTEYGILFLGDSQTPSGIQGHLIFLAFFIAAICFTGFFFYAAIRQFKLHKKEKSMKKHHIKTKKRG